MINKDKLLEIIKNKKIINITIAALIAIGIIISLVILHKTENNLIRLEIFRFCFIMLLISAFGICCILLWQKAKLENIYLFTAITLGIAYMFSITPLSVGDEAHHYQSAYIVSGYMLFKEDPYSAEASHFDYNELAGHYNVPGAYIRFFDEGIVSSDAESEKIDLVMPETYTLDYPLFYLPQAMGITIARLLGLGFFGIFYLGRLFNLLFYVFCVSFSIKRLAAFRLPVFLTGLLPMSLHQAASMSNDTFIFGVSILFIAYAISCIYEKETFLRSDYIVLLTAGVLLSPAKVVYFPIVFLVFLAAWKWKDTIGYKAWILAASITAASTLVILIFMGSNAAAMAGEQDLNWEGGRNYTLSFILENPVETIKIFLRSLYHMREWYFYSLFGQFLSGLTLILPRWYIRVIVAILVAGIVYGKKEEWQPSWLHRGTYFTICAAVVVLNLTAMFLGWTSDWHPVVLGIQGRYFIPVLPLALLMLKNKFTQIDKLFYHNTVIIVYLIMQCAVIMYILDFTIGAYV